MKVLINNQKFEVEIANSFKKKLFGLMGKSNIKHGLFFPKTNSIHTFFMKEAIDIIMIDKNNTVVYFQKNLPPNKIIIKKKAYHTIELPHNSLKEISIKDELTMC